MRLLEFTNVRCTEAAVCEEVKVRTVYRGRQRLKTEGPYGVPRPATSEDWRSVRCTEAGSVWRREGPYSVPRPETSEDVKVRTVYRSRQRLKTESPYGVPRPAASEDWRPVCCTEAGSVWRREGPYSVPRPAACEDVKVRTVYRGLQRVFQGPYRAPSSYH